jgi:putative oxidoreductase
MAGVFMLCFHGYPKIQKFDYLVSVFPDPFGIGSTASLCLVIFAEVFCSVLLITGTVVRLASLPLIITMFVASFIIHAEDPISKIELPLMYLTIYVTLFISGPGKWAFQPQLRPKITSETLRKLLT